MQGPAASNMPQSSATPTSSTGQEGLGFLGTLAGAAETNNSSETTTNTFTNSASSQSVDPERFERYGRRIDKLMQRLELIERKMERIEHRLDVG